jgi:hypothetical protein
VWAWVAVGGWIGSGWIDIDTGSGDGALGGFGAWAAGNRQQAAPNGAVFALHVAAVYDLASTKGSVYK